MESASISNYSDSVLIFSSISLQVGASAWILELQLYGLTWQQNTYIIDYLNWLTIQENLSSYSVFICWEQWWS